MSIRTIQDVLPLVEQPSRYLGSEVNTIKKDHEKVKLRMALAFPDLYEIGTSHFGLQILYQILNRQKDIAAERVFAPGLDMAAYLESGDISIPSLESQTPLNRFDIIGFSLLYELNYTGILSILKLAKIPFFASERDLSHPLIIAGGPCACNPEPVAELFDAMVVGDGEEVVIEMARIWIEWKASGGGDKETLLKQWSNLEGVYVPAFFEPEYDERGFQKMEPRFEHYQKVRRTVIDDLNRATFPDRPIIPFGKPVHDRLRLEVSRGCTRGCRFCQAGMIYRPVRERSIQTLSALSDASIASTGYEDVSLLSLSTTDYGCIVALMEHLMARFESRRIAVSFPSLRAGTLTPQLMQLIKRVRKTGFTIAPEAGSQRLRDAVNKNISEADIIDTVKDASRMGWQVIKLYFMVGLPTETDQDLQAIVDLVRKLRKIKVNNKKGLKINVSVATFIPKPHTPFQWVSQLSLARSKDRMRWLQDNLRMPGIQFKWQNPEVSFLEGLWSRGDRRLSRLLVAAYQKGCRLDGWSDKFQYRLWQETFSEEGVDLDFYTTRKRDMDEPLPWDHIDTGVAKDFLKTEWKKAINGDQTPDCRNGECNDCGVCDFDRIKPIVYETCSETVETSLPSGQPAATFYKRLKIAYSKQGQAKYFGHLELVRIFLRAIRRAGITVRFSEGFHPKPRISFDDPLPIGLESLNEHFYLEAADNQEPQTIVKKLNQQLPEGLRVSDCQPAVSKPARNSPVAVTYLVIKKDGFFDEKELSSFKNKPELIYRQTDRKGKTKEIDLKTLVLQIELLDPDRLQMTLRSEPGKSMRPSAVIGRIFSLPEDAIRQAKTVKTSSENV
ncbi:MAG: TIGR03960 family B12-binding radical SAM protein [Pseudomonadota bacterium]|uniref:TIGR03960 family B12-binding radical SAM protein n=1 Tax=Candidatus Desulfatibia profunda TaxID=2841695 RepID=A0A8J6TJ05_9BACT|nr:TIGR03960 family B12-binding radical SAM protein [Candidatus Desulfatibia profunda]MBL7180002.1 TIGR03960 family B12-binding radical SAM protein [Desulfobacterales bacterium]